MAIISTTVIITIAHLMNIMGQDIKPESNEDPCLSVGAYYAVDGTCVWYTKHKEIEFTWGEHNAECGKHGPGTTGGRLVSITTLDKEEFIENQVVGNVSDGDVVGWIGFRSNADKDLIWVNGVSISYENFKDQREDLVVEEMNSCGYLGGTMKWSVRNCKDPSWGRICETSVCNSFKCQHICDRFSSSGKFCRCFTGFELVNDTHCEPIDLCGDNFGGCEHKLCKMENGTTKMCECREGFKVVDDKCEKETEKDDDDDEENEGWNSNIYIIPGIVLSALACLSCLMFVAYARRKSVSPSDLKMEEFEMKMSQRRSFSSKGAGSHIMEKERTKQIERMQREDISSDNEDSLMYGTLVL